MIDTASLFTYLGIFAALIATGLGAPVPEEMPIIAAGVKVGIDSKEPEFPEELLSVLCVSPHATYPANLPWTTLALCKQEPELWDPQRFDQPPRHQLRWWIMLPVCILGVVIGDGLLYGIGRFSGPRLLETRWLKRILSSERRLRIEENFQRYGVLVLLFARLLPAIRSPIFIMAGVTRVSFAKFIIADGLYAIPGVSLLFTLSFWFGDKFRDLFMRAEGKMKTILVLLALTAVAGYLLHHFFRHPVATGDPNLEMPLVGAQIASKMPQPEPIAPPPPANNLPDRADNAALPPHEPEKEPRA